jgi:hypothetical protein
MQELKPNLMLASSHWDFFEESPFLVQIESSLSSAFQVRRAYQFSYAYEAAIVIAFVFSVSLITTGFFQKMGADIYDGMRGTLEGLWRKLRDKAREKAQKPVPVQFQFEIEQEDATSVVGFFVSDNWELFHQTVLNLHRLQEAFEQVRQTEKKRIYSFRLSASGDWIWLEWKR